LLVIGGLLLTIYSRFLPFRAMGHAVQVLRGKYDDPNDPGEISHFQALATALSSTIGLGNIGGVAIAISQGGPGAVFWMWVAALLGMTTKFFTCTLAVMYREPDENGVPQGGPMYYIEQGLGPRWRWMAMFFSVCGMIGCLAIFQTNQLAEIMMEAASVEGWVTGLVCTAVVSVVLLGGLKRIALVASRLVPAMCALYLVMVLTIVGMHISEVPAMFSMIVSHAFNGGAVVGGAEGIAFWVVFQTGIKRAAFSNEAGVGTAPMAHGAARTKEPVREGLVAMIGPFIDTIIVCSLTAFAIIATDVWSTDSVRGVGMTLLAFETALGPIGKYGLLLVVSLFGATTMFGYSYYGRKCFSYLFGASKVRIYDAFYLFMLFIGAVWAADVVVNLLDTSFALMAFPNMLATLILAPRVIKETRAYFARMKDGKA
jgi:AGCS family alanine or glycine:cation symporter